MRLASFFLPSSARRAGLRASARAIRPTPSFSKRDAAAPIVDAVPWLMRRASARQAEWNDVVAAIEAAWQLGDGNERLAARAYADMERRGEVVRRYVSPAMRPDALALWWLRVGRKRSQRSRAGEIGAMSGER